MLSICKISNSGLRESYFQFGDYLSEKDRVVGTWQGSIAEMPEWKNVLGNGIGSESGAYDLLEQNINPITGERLTARSKKIRSYDCVLGDNKYVSFLAVAMNDKRILKAHKEGVKLANKEMEKFIAYRDKRGDKHNIKDNVVYSQKMLSACFTHEFSRTLDPHLHTHINILNFTIDKDGNYKSISNRELYKGRQFISRFYQNYMAREIQKMGYEIELDKNEKGKIKSFKIKGIDEKIIDKFNQRSNQVKEQIEAYKARTGKEPDRNLINKIITATRPEKMTELSREEIIEEIQGKLNAKELADSHSLIASSREREQNLKGIETVNSKEALKDAIEHLYERKSIAEGHQILAEALADNLGKIDQNDLINALRNSETVKLQEKSNEHCNIITTRKNLQLEQNSINIINQGKNRFDSLGSLDKAHFDFKSTEQAAFVIGILSNKNFAVVGEGYAGTGKTTALKEMQKGFEAAGKNTQFLAPTRRAVQVLKDEGFNNSTTVADILIRKGNNLKPGSVLIVDEAGLLSTKAGHNILELAKEKNCRIVLLGDARQHKSVEAGDFLRNLQTHSQIDTFKLHTIHRQQDAQYKEAAQLIYKNNQKALEKFNDMGWIKEDKDYLSKAAEKYIKMTDGGKNLDKCLMVCPTHRENKVATEQIRKARIDSGLLKNESEIQVFVKNSELSLAKKKQLKNYEVGQVIQFNQNVYDRSEKQTLFKSGQSFKIKEIDRKNKTLISQDGQRIKLKTCARHFDVGHLEQIQLGIGDKIQATRNDKTTGIVNGELYTLKEIDKENLILANSENEKITISKNFENLRHGYALTSHSSQGVTVDNVICAGAKYDKEAFLVSATRGRYNYRCFVPDKKIFGKNLEKDTTRSSALDVLNSKENCINQLQNEALKALNPQKDQNIATQNQKIFDRFIEKNQREKTVSSPKKSKSLEEWKKDLAEAPQKRNDNLPLPSKEKSITTENKKILEKFINRSKSKTQNKNKDIDISL